MNNSNLHMRRYFIFQYRSAKMLLMKLESELPNLVKKLQSVLKIWTKCRLNFHEAERTRAAFKHKNMQTKGHYT